MSGLLTDKPSGLLLMGKPFDPLLACTDYGMKSITYVVSCYSTHEWSCYCRLLLVVVSSIPTSSPHPPGINMSQIDVTQNEYGREPSEVVLLAGIEG